MLQSVRAFRGCPSADTEHSVRDYESVFMVLSVAEVRMTLFMHAGVGCVGITLMSRSRCLPREWGSCRTIVTNDGD